MSPTAMVVVQVVPEYSPQMSLVQNDHVIQALAPNRTDHPLDVRVLPRCRACLPNTYEDSPCQEGAPV